MSAPPVVLAVAGTDSGGAAGLAADLATIGHLGAHAACVATAVTAQDTTGVHAVHPVPDDVVAAQLDAVLGDLPVAAVKTGMVGTPEVVALVADRLGHLPLVVDPVLVATSGAVLGDEAVARAYRDRLLPVATVTTPNADEARALTGHDGPPAELAARVADLGCAVLLTGGPEWRPGAAAATCTDWLALPGAAPVPLAHPAVPTTADHGTGCTHSAALATLLARALPPATPSATPSTTPPTDGPNAGGAAPPPRQLPGAEVLRSVGLRAAAYTTHQLRGSRHWDLGAGRGPVSHLPPRPHTPTPPRREA